MSDFTDKVDDAVNTLERAGGRVAKVRIESERLSDYYANVAYINGQPPHYDIIADPDVDAYEVMLKREVDT